VQFVVIGGGLDYPALEAEAAARGLPNVRFVPRQPEERMPGWFALADVLFLHLTRDPLFEITIPSKVYAYLACERPVLCAVGGDTARIVEGAGAGIAVPPQDPEALAAAVRRLAALPEDERRAMGGAGRAAFLAGYTRDVLMNRFEALLEDVVRAHRGPARGARP
jgi:colanic acid biosynthesis glycosyl transferase WcaI